MSVEFFELAVSAVITGDEPVLRSLLKQQPNLITARSSRPHHATLLHYTSANGVEDEHQLSPANAPVIAKILLDGGAEVDALCDSYGQSTALTLVASSGHPKRAGIQLPLMQTLLDYGALIDGVPGTGSPILAALHNGCPAGAQYLAAHGTRLNLESAAGTGNLAAVQAYFDPQGNLILPATQSQLELGFVWACEYGHIPVIEFLLSHGASIETQAGTGLPSLHWAIVGGQLEAIKFLLEKGASRQVINRYGGDALGQAQWSLLNGEQEINYGAVVDFLRHT